MNKFRFVGHLNDAQRAQSRHPHPHPHPVIPQLHSDLQHLSKTLKSDFFFYFSPLSSYRLNLADFVFYLHKLQRNM